MEKVTITLLFLITLIFLSNFVLGDVECSKDKDCNDGKSFTTDTCENSGTDESSCVNEPKDNQLGLLYTIWLKLTELVDKDWSVNIESPEVNVEVNPNITLPDKECKWEIYSQTNEINLEGDGSEAFISVPENQIVKEINVTKAYALFKWQSGGSDKSVIKVNDIECLSKGGNSGENYYMNSFNPNCLYTFNEGLNNINIDNLESSGNPIGIKTMWLEMELKPANC